MSRHLLLDTHVLLWWLAGEPLEAGAAEAIADPANSVRVSSVSVWEIAIKRELGKLRFDGSPSAETESAGFGLLAITAGHAEAAGELPPHHRDPFDRMLVAQARAERMTVVTRDAVFDRYEVPLLRC